MTDTTDIKALRELLCHEDLESDYHVGVTVTTLRLLLSKADQLEAERQRADRYRQKWTDTISDNCAAGKRIKDLEAELAALKGDQVPVYQIEDADGWQDCEKDEYYSLIKSQSIPDVYCRVLFTAPRKPVIDLSNVLKVPYKISGQRFTAYDSDDLHAAIEAAGGIVKDGE